MKESYRILVVDDEPELRKSIITVLENHGYQTMEAGDGAEACRLALSERSI